MFWKWISHLEKPLRRLTHDAALLADVRLKRVTSQSSRSYFWSFYKYSPVSSFTNPLMAHRRWSNLCVRMCQMLSPWTAACYCDGEEQEAMKQWRGCLSLAFYPVRWKSDITAQSSQHYCSLRLASPPSLCVCVCVLQSFHCCHCAEQNPVPHCRTAQDAW